MSSFGNATPSRVNAAYAPREQPVAVPTAGRKSPQSFPRSRWSFIPPLARADVAADFKARDKLSLADAFAAALAKERNADLVTGAPEFKALKKEIKIGGPR